MFTGIVTPARVVSASKRGGIRCVRIARPPKWRLARGGSVAVDGVCSTIVALSRASFDVEYMPQTLENTTMNDVRAGARVNLELPLAVGSRVEGHFVLGHVDARARVARVERRGASHRLFVSVPVPLRRFVAERGSIALNGVSLTIASVSGGEASVALIPFTLEHTNLGALKKGDFVNLEVDALARSVAALLSRGRVPAHAKKKRGTHG